MSQKKLANTFSKKTFRNMLRKKMNIATDKYPRTNTVIILYCKNTLMHYFLFTVVFSNVCRQLLTL